MTSQIFPVLVNKVCNHRYVYWIFSFFAVLPPPLWESRRRVWEIADNASNLLDVGCGYAHMTRSSRAENVFALDLDRTAMKMANTFGKSNFFPVYGSATNLPFRDGAFDTVVATEIIEHIVNSDCCVADLCRVLTDKGRMLVSTPNGAILTQVHRDHVCHFTEKALASLLSPPFQFRKIEKRFGVSFLLTCRLTSLRSLRRRHSHEPRKHEEKSRTSKLFILMVPLLIIMSPIVNLIQEVEDKMEKGKCNLVVECTKV
jgi:SAM-dependent methyltransferase